jgi:agmatinase
MVTGGRTFLGVPSCDLAGALPPAGFIVVGAADATPYNPGQSSHAANAPLAIREALRGYEQDLLRRDFDHGGPLLDLSHTTVLDAGNLSTSPDTPEQNRETITGAMRAIVGSGSVPILIGGDDSVPIPLFAAYDGLGDITIVQVDAHLDWKHERNGILHTFASPMRRASEMAWVRNIVQVGLRGIGGSGENEYRAAIDWGARIVTAREFQRCGIDLVLQHIQPGSRCIITIDCDGLDPSVMPGVLIPQHGGLGYFDVVSIIEKVAERATIVGFDIVELVPERDTNGLGALAAARIICNVIRAIAATTKAS